MEPTFFVADSHIAKNYVLCKRTLKPDMGDQYTCFCACKQPCRQVGLLYECAGQEADKKCTFKVDVAAFKHFALNGYMDFNGKEKDSDGNDVFVQNIQWPICNVCRAAMTQKQRPVTFKLFSYLSPKCSKYVSYQKIIFGCGCSSPTNMWNLEESYHKGWKKGFEAPKKDIKGSDEGHATATSSFGYRDPLDD